MQYNLSKMNERIKLHNKVTVITCVPIITHNVCRCRRMMDGLVLKWACLHICVSAYEVGDERTQ